MGWTRGQNVFEESKVEMIFPHERGGKRDARVASARAGLELVSAQADVRRLEIGHQVRKAYFAVLAAEQSFALTEASLSLARSFADTVAEKCAPGRFPRSRDSGAVRLHGVSADLERARREVALARADLALAVGDPGVRSEALEGHLPEDTTIPDPAALTAQIAGSSDLKLLEREVLVRRSALAEESTRDTRDIAWRVAANYNRLDQEAWATVGVTIPLFAAGRNRGALAAATADVERAEQEHAAAQRRLTAELGRAVAGLQASARGRDPQEQRARWRRAGLRHRAGRLSSREVPVPRRPRRL
jgi:cobalt-zinc-cadmium efflux system outer membrane protein